MTTSPQGFLTISAGYKFRTGALKPSSTLKPMKRSHKRNNSCNKGYRAYDKQRLLQQIDMKIKKQNYILQENRQLKEQINIGANINQAVKWDRAPKLMIDALIQENQQLNNSIRDKQQQIQQIKKSTAYTDFLETFTQYSSNKDELNRLKKLYSQRRKKIIESQKTLLKQNAQKINKLQCKQQDINKAKDKNQYLKDFLENVEQELEHYKNKNKQLSKKQKKLTDDVDDLKARVKAQKVIAKVQFSKKQIKAYDSVFIKAVKTKSLKQKTQPSTQQKIISQQQQPQPQPKKHENQNKLANKDKDSTLHHPWPQPLHKQSQHSQQQSESEFGQQQQEQHHIKHASTDNHHRNNECSEPSSGPASDVSF